MKLKVEKVAVQSRRAEGDVDLQTFVETVRNLKVGESFLLPSIQSNHRYAISVLQYAYNRKFITRTLDDGVRVGRSH